MKVRLSQELSQKKRIHFNIKNLVSWENDEYSMSISRELRRLKQNKLINYVVTNKCKGEYDLLPISGRKYNEKIIGEMLERAVVIVKGESRKYNSFNEIIYDRLRRIQKISPKT